MSALVHLVRWLAWQTGGGAARPASAPARITVLSVGARGRQTP
jgi:hypothetical protein